MILEGAINYFADYGFDVRTRELAAHLKISQSLIFRYFPNKAALIDSVYDVVFLNRWNSDWEQTLVNRSQDLRTRLISFYRDYYRSVNRYEVIRISLYAALRGESLNQRYMQLVSERLVQPIAKEVRAELNLPADVSAELDAIHQELVFALHAGLIYAIIRKHVFTLPIAENMDYMIELMVDNFLTGASTTFARTLKN